jgi:prepilin-type N-terminal cleavage/methylation domain-containing protein/prepilin-type processing-associated H-X9-DG protein
MPRRAFTLIELLVVIAIIATLIAILLPALASAREAGRQTRCLANTRSIAQALTMYSDSNRETYPYWSAWHTWQGDGTGDDTPGPGWCEMAAEYLDSREVFVCPGRNRPEVPFAYFLQSRYASIINSGRMRSSIRTPQILFSSQFVLTGDANQPILFSAPYGDSPKAPNCDPDDARWPSVFFEGELVGHKGSNNIAFHDGHAGTFTRYEPQEMTWHGREMRNWQQDLAPPPGGE